MLDVSIRTSVLNLMRIISNEMELTTVYISHDLALIRYMCHEIAIMYLGKIVEKGLTEEVIKNSCHPYTRALIAAVSNSDPEIKSEEVKIKNYVPSQINLPPAVFFKIVAQLLLKYVLKWNQK